MRLDPSRTAPLDLQYRVLDRTGPARRLLVLLHGYAEPAEPLTDRLDLLDPTGTCLAVVPEAPFERRGAAIWHRAVLNAPLEAAEQFERSLISLDALLGRLGDDTGLDPAEAVVGGFSQGGGLSFGLALGAGVRHRPAATFGVCSFPPAFGGFRVDRAGAAGRPGFLVSAHRDHFAPIELSRGGAAALREVGIELTYAEVDTEHVMSDEAAALAGRWLDAVLRGEAPTGFDDLLDDVDPLDGFYEDLWVLES